MCECLCVYARIAYLQTPSRLEATMRGNVFRPAANGIGEGWTFFFGMGGGRRMDRRVDGNGQRRLRGDVYGKG